MSDTVTDTDTDPSADPDASATGATVNDQAARSGLAMVGRVLAMAWSGAIAILVIGLIVVVAMGLRIQVVETASMSPSIPVGALALMEPTSGDAAERLDEGDVIAFQHPKVDQLVLHRIVAVHEVDGQPRFQTKGDANAAPDGGLVAPEDVHSTLDRSIPGLGKVLLWLRPPFGLVILVGIPLLVIGAGRVARRLQTHEPGDLAAAT